MSQPIKIKNSSTASKVPQTTDLALGELAINTHDGKLFLKKDDGTTQTIVEVGAIAGQTQADWAVSDTASVAFIKNKPVLAAVATSGNKADVGLGNAEDKSSATIRGELTASNVTTALAYTPSRSASFASAPVERALVAVDSRTISNPSTGIGYAGGGRFRFGYMNDSSGNYADIIDLSTYTDNTAGGYNSLYFNKSSQQLQHKWAAAGGTAWSVKTIAYLDSTITGNAANVTGTVGLANGGTGATTAAAALTNLGAAPSNAPTFTGLVSVTGTRPLTYDPNVGGLTIKGNAAGWATGLQFQGSSGTNFGGFYGYGSSDTMNWYAIGDSYQSGWLTVVRSTGATLLGGTTDDGTNRLQVTGSVKASGAIAAGTGLTAAKGTTGEVSLGTDGNGSIEIGQGGRSTAGTPFIDFHSAANSGDYDVRMMVSGGSTTVGQGNMNITAALFQINGHTVFDNSATIPIANGGTGSTNATAALTNLGAFGLQATPLGTGVDLNTIQTTGFYYQNSNANASGGTNYPTAQAGKLTVYMNNVFIYQEYHVYNTPDIYTRGYYNGSWSAWQKHLHSGNYNSYSPTLTGGGASGTWGIAISGNAATASNTSSISNAVGTSYTWTGAQYFTHNYGSTATVTATGTTSPGLMAYSSDNGPAVMSFHRGGQYAVNMGIDTDNVIRMGGWSAAANIFQFDVSANSTKGNFTALGNVTAYSDERLKDNWRSVPVNFVAQWANVKSGIYDRKDTGHTQVGLSAQSVQKVLPNAVQEGSDGFLSLNYGAASAVATVELAKEVMILRAELKKQNELIELLMSKVGM